MAVLLLSIIAWRAPRYYRAAARNVIELDDHRKLGTRQPNYSHRVIVLSQVMYMRRFGPG